MFNPSTTPFQPGQIDQTMAMLASLKDQGKLQQYVMQHQCNPNLVALASQVNSMSQQSAQPGPQATVKDQAIQAMGQPGQPMGQPAQTADPEIMIRQAIDESIANKDFETAQKLIKQLKQIDKTIPQEVPGGGALPGDNPNSPHGGSPMTLPEEQGIGTLPAQNLQGMGHAEGGIIGYAPGGMPASTYKPTTMEDINNVTSQSQPLTAEEIAAQRANIVNPMNKEMETAYAPYNQKLDQRQAEIDKSKGSNVGMALLTAGLGMMAGTSPYAMANIGQGGLRGLDTYAAAQKADQQAQQALDNSQMLMMQAQRAERSGNNRDATTLIDAAQRQKEAHVAHGLTALQIKDTSQFNQEKAIVDRFNAETNNKRAATEAAKAQHEFEFDTNFKGPYYKAEGEAALNRSDAEKSRIIPKEEQKLFRVQTAINNDDTINSMAKSLQDDLKMGNIDFGSKEYYQRLDAIHEQKLPYYEQSGLTPPRKPSDVRKGGGSNPIQVPNPINAIPVAPAAPMSPASTGLPTAQQAGAPGWSIKPLP